MTDIKAKVVEFDLKPHNNADLLSVAVIKGTGWQCVVKTSDFVDKNIGVYIPIDAEVDTTNPTFSFLNKGNDKPARVKTIRLRKVLSQGLLIPAPDWAKLGDDLTEHYNVKRYEPPIPANLRGDMVRSPGLFQRYTSIENYKNFPNVLKDGEKVRVSEKLHGTNFRAGYVHDGKYEGEFNDVPVLDFFVGSHNTAKNPEGENEYSKIAKTLSLKNKLNSLLDKYKPKFNFIVYGELYGHKIQHLHYGCGKNERKLRIFDVLIDEEYQSWAVIQDVAKHIGTDTVPLLYHGPYSLDKIMELRDGKTTISNDHEREGVVVTADPERTDEEIGRVIVKFISDDYLIKAGKPGATDGH